MNWWHRREINHVWFFIAAIVFFAIMITWQLITVSMAYAEACLSIDVPPQAVLRQFDGDTFTLFTFGPGGEVDVRVQDVDTPERTKKESGWAEAREFTRDWLNDGVFHVETCGVHTFGRIVAIVSRNGETLAEALRLAGHGK